MTLRSQRLPQGASVLASEASAQSVQYIHRLNVYMSLAIISPSPQFHPHQISTNSESCSNLIEHVQSFNMYSPHQIQTSTFICEYQLRSLFQRAAALAIGAPHSVPLSSDSQTHSMPLAGPSCPAPISATPTPDVPVFLSEQHIFATRHRQDVFLLSRLAFISHCAPRHVVSPPMMFSL